MQGFKSFPDKINIEFGRGVTAIVGPNGSGKSNIVDAIRWVLGEQSTKNLRGAKMEDVIFGGTADRPQVGFAEVSLTLDNTGGELQSEFSEVTVTRRYYRSGESEYYLNKRACRLKDINELFMNTGLGRDGYSMIGQGRIAEILSVRSEDRRAIFEEAAGISKYRYRKLESERRLAATEENLVRLRDIESELAERVEPLRAQSAKAKKYLDYREERKQLEINVWLDSVERTGDVLSKIADDSAAIERELETLRGEAERKEREIDGVFDRTREKNVEIEELRREIKEIEEQSGERLRELAVAKNNAQHARARAEELADGAESERRERELAAREEALHGEREEALRLAEERERRLEALRREAETADGARGELREQLAARRGTLFERSAALTDGKLKLTALAESLRAADERERAIDGELSRRETRRTELAEEAELCKTERAALEETLSSAQNVIAGYERKLAARMEKQQTLTAEVQKLTAERGEKLQRRRVLSDMERQMEGSPHSVKRVMKEAAHGTLAGICGPLSGLIRVEDEYAVAVETACGAALSHIVTESEEDAKRAIRLLKNERAGRATFLPVSSIRGRTLAERGLSDEPGYVGLASELLRCEERFSEVVASVCGRCAVAETLDRAVAIAKKYGYRFKVVSLDGQVVNVGGSLTGGSQQRGAGVLTRRNQIDALAAEIETLTAALSRAQETLDRAAEETAAVRAALAGAKAEETAATDRLRELSYKREQVDGLLRAEQEAAAALRRERETLLDRSARERAERETLGRAQEALEAEIAALEAEIRAAEQESEDAAAARERTLSELSELKLAGAEDRARADAAQRSLEETARQREELRSECADRERAAAEKRAEAERISAEIAALEAEIAQLADRVEAGQEAVRARGRERDEIERSVTALRTEAAELQERRERLLAEQMRLAQKKGAVEAEYDGVVAKLWDEYELTITTAMAQRTELADLAGAKRRIQELRAAMKALGNVNIDAIAEYKEVRERYEFYTAQIADLEQSKTELLKIIEDLTEMMRSIFGEQFTVINEKFNLVFRELFGGGSAKLELTDPSDVLTSGIEIKVNPPGKLIKNLQLLSGGEQTFVAIALYFAILAVKPVPFCIMDEIEAALDDVNVTRFAQYLRKYCGETQFIVVTHRRGTMEEADVLYGVTMQEKGVSKLLTIKVSEIEKQLGIKV